MAEFNLARVRRHMCRGLVILGLFVSNTMSIGNQQTVKAPFAIASVQATRNSIHSESQFQRNCSNGFLHENFVTQ